MKIILSPLLGLAALIAACGADSDNYKPLPEESGSLPKDANHPDGKAAKPKYVIRLPGEEVRFLVDEYGSVGLFGASQTGVSVLDEPELDEASPAVVFHALSTEPIPEDLLWLHDDLVKQGRSAPLEETIAGRIAGWARPRAQAISEPCRNSTFRDRHCSHPAYAQSSCWLNVTGNRTSIISHADRYKGGFCLQNGHLVSYLWRVNQNGCGMNDYDSNSFAYIWGENSTYYPSNPYSATTYFTYVWWRPSNAPLRRFYMSTGINNGPDGTYDVAQRYTRDPC